MWTLNKVLCSLLYRTTKDLPGGGNFSDGLSDRASSVNPSDSTSLASLADLSDDSTIERSHTPTPPVADPHADFTPRPHSGSTGDLPSTTQNSTRLFRRQLSAVETQTNYMRDLLKDTLPSRKKSGSVRGDEKSRGEEAMNFAPGSTPQYKVIYRDMCEVTSSGGSVGPERVRLVIINPLVHIYQKKKNYIRNRSKRCKCKRVICHRHVVIIIITWSSSTRDHNFHVIITLS